jgi:hypothetical protein
MLVPATRAARALIELIAHLTDVDMLGPTTQFGDELDLDELLRELDREP